jgi:NADH:ubiquinone oxidoreductase subunit F (NADH-binding)
VTVTPLATVHRLLAGPDPRLGPEPLRSHLTRLGARPRGTAGTPPPFVGELERSGLRGRGGAAFPTARKWSAVASRSRGHAVVVANGSEGEPASWKDRTLMALRPHLVIDGLLLAAETVGAAEAVIYLPRAFDAAHASLSRAIDERREQGERLRTRLRIAAGPHRYVAGEESAVVAHLNGGEAKPTVTPPRPFERGVMGRPTLVQNVETLAHTALIARLGSGWFRSAGTAGAPGTALCSIGGAVAAPGLVEIALGTTVAELVAMAGGGTAPPEAVLIGGYGGRWLPAATALPAALGVDVPLGPGIVVVLSAEDCGLAETVEVLAFLARESARQCGPCLHGLDALHSTLAAVVVGTARPADLDRLARWCGQIAGRGACHHPDGAVMLLRTALETFAASARVHLRRGPCRGCRRPRLLPTPIMDTRWR